MGTGVGSDHRYQAQLAAVTVQRGFAGSDTRQMASLRKEPVKLHAPETDPLKVEGTAIKQAALRFFLIIMLKCVGLLWAPELASS